MTAPFAPDPHDLAASLRAMIAANRAMADALERMLPKPVEKPAPVFVPTDLQQRILDALAGKALRTDALWQRCDCNRRSLFNDPGGLPELQEQGLVAHHARTGYYRPDCPPPELRT